MRECAYVRKSEELYGRITLNWRSSALFSLFLHGLHHKAERFSHHGCVTFVHKGGGTGFIFGYQGEVELIIRIHIEGNGIELQKMFEFGGVFHKSLPEHATCVCYGVIFTLLTIAMIRFRAFCSSYTAGFPFSSSQALQDELRNFSKMVQCIPSSLKM